MEKAVVDISFCALDGLNKNRFAVSFPAKQCAV